MVLVDTSIWIEALGPRPGAATERLRAFLDRGEPCAVAPPIIQEVLQGARSVVEFKQLETYLRSQRIIYPLDPLATYIAAAGLYAECRWAGVTPRSSMDCLIAQLAIEHKVRLLHADSDFDLIARVVPQLIIC